MSRCDPSNLASICIAASHSLAPRQTNMRNSSNNNTPKIAKRVPDSNEEYDKTGLRQDNYLESGLG